MPAHQGSERGEKPELPLVVSTAPISLERRTFSIVIISASHCAGAHSLKSTCYQCGLDSIDLLVRYFLSPFRMRQTSNVIGSSRRRCNLSRPFFAPRHNLYALFLAASQPYDSCPVIVTLGPNFKASNLKQARHSFLYC